MCHQCRGPQHVAQLILQPPSHRWHSASKFIFGCVHAPTLTTQFHFCSHTRLHRWHGVCPSLPPPPPPSAPKCLHGLQVQVKVVCHVIKEVITGTWRVNLWLRAHRAMRHQHKQTTETTCNHQLNTTRRTHTGYMSSQLNATHDTLSTQCHPRCIVDSTPPHDALSTQVTQQHSLSHPLILIDVLCSTVVTVLVQINMYQLFIISVMPLVLSW